MQRAPSPSQVTPRHRAGRWVLGIGMALLVLLSGGGLWLVSQLPSGDELARQAEKEFERRFGIGLQIGQAHWQWRPRPVLVFADVRTRQSAPITLSRITAAPQLRPLLDRQIALHEVTVDDIHLPSASARAFRGRETRADDPAPGGHWRPAPIPLARFVFKQLRWVDRRGIELAYAGQVDFDADWMPRTAVLQRPDAASPAQLRLTREPSDAAGPTHIWQVQAEVGGGSWEGQAKLRESAQQGEAMQLSADLQLREVDVAQLVSTFGRRPALEGRASGRTILQAQGSRPGELLRSLRTRTDFRVAPATLLRFDLARTVRTLGQERAGQTVLDELRGSLQTQATDRGVRLRYRDLHARSGVLTARGQLQVFNRQLQGRLAIDLVDGLVGVPLLLAGTLDAPELGLSSGALAGAAAGTAVAPGVGTALGARLGQKLEDWFGDEDNEAPAKPRGNDGSSNEKR